mmetsp:Transcript_9054/g.25935  ORF Transcript_9054/g.25935 Transcript_9054/m.25935 type:complete len:529 (+) Transcript_9054:430-2016(+)
MVTAERLRLHLRKDNGLVRDVFQQHHMLELRGNMGIGHVRYPTAGTSSCAEAQPLYTNYPYGICVAHNGNLTNTDELYDHMIGKQRHVNTDSDSELLLNLFAESLKSNSTTTDNMVDSVFATVSEIMGQCKGGYATCYLVNGVGLVGFRDPHGIRPLTFGCRRQNNGNKINGNAPADLTIEDLENGNEAIDYVVASESVAIDTLGFQLVRDVKPGEAIFVDMNTGKCHTKMCAPNAQLAPCIFEYVYFARPDSIMDGVSVYESRLNMGSKLAEKINRVYPNHDIDVVIPIPDTSRTSALQCAYGLGCPFREGFIKNRYIARTFIMPGQATRKKSVRLKLNTIKSEFAGRNVLLVDDSIVRGTTAHEIVQMARDAGAAKVYFCSAAPPIRYPNIYGIDIPTREELIAYERNEEQIAQKIGCEWVVYQDLDDLVDSVKSIADNSNNEAQQPLTTFDTSCFSGTYVTGESMGDEYFTKLFALRNDDAKQKRLGNGNTDGKPQQSNAGCESASNDTRNNKSNEDACESITNL